MPIGSYVGRGRVWGRCEESVGAVVAVDEGSGSALPDDSGAVADVVAAADVVAVAVAVTVALAVTVVVVAGAVGAP